MSIFIYLIYSVQRSTGAVKLYVADILSNTSEIAFGSYLLTHNHVIPQGSDYLSSQARNCLIKLEPENLFCAVKDSYVVE